MIYNNKEYDCPLDLAMDIVGGKWKSIIIYRLKDGALRSGELQKMVSGISNKMFTSSLRELEQNRLISRKVYPVSPPKVEYRLTEDGEALVPILLDIVRWGYRLSKKR
ncbi:MAG: winged helix-turn-helix transcriptional regulator [Bacteroidales bacterium]